MLLMSGALCRYRAKKLRRCFRKTVRYECRKVRATGGAAPPACWGGGPLPAQAAAVAGSMRCACASLQPVQCAIR